MDDGKSLRDQTFVLFRFSRRVGRDSLAPVMGWKEELCSEGRGCERIGSQYAPR